MTTHSRIWQTTAWVLIVLLACVVGAAGLARLGWTPVVGLIVVAGIVLLLAGLVCSARSRGRLRLLAVLDAYTERELDRERSRTARAARLA